MAEIMQGVVSSIENKMQVKVRPLGIGDSDAVTPPLFLQKITIEIEQGEQTATVTKIYPDVKVGDVLELQLGARAVKAEVLSVSEYAKKEEAAAMYRILEEAV